MLNQKNTIRVSMAAFFGTMGLGLILLSLGSQEGQAAAPGESPANSASPSCTPISDRAGKSGPAAPVVESPAGSQAGSAGDAPAPAPTPSAT